MPDFTVLFPPEIVRFISSHLRQDDCLESMCVSHRWYNLIPYFMKEAWDTVQISCDTYPKVNDRLLHCLSLHGNKLHINTPDTYHILKMLANRACSFTSIDITSHQPTTLESVRCSPFVFLLQFSDTLRELTLFNQSKAVSPLELLSHLPALTHLTLLFNCTFDQRLSSILQCTSVKNTISNLVFLYLDGGFLYERKIITVLEHCPYLKALIVANGEDGRQPPYTNTEFCTILELCPQLRFVKWDNPKYDTVVDPNTEEVQLWKELSIATEDNSETGIRVLDISDYRYKKRYASLPLLMLSQQTLENLSIKNGIGCSGSLGLKNIQLPQVKHLDVHGVTMDLSDWCRLIRSCNEYMEYVSLTSCRWTGDDTMDPLVTSLSSFHRLRHLTLEITFFDDVGRNPGTCNNFGALSANTHLHSLDIMDIRISGQGLLDLCDILSLRELGISLSRSSYRYGLQAYEMVAFAQKLAAMDSNIHTLSFSKIDSITDVVLEDLSRVKRLSVLSLSNCQNLTDKGANLFLRGKEKNPDLPRTLRLKACYNCRTI